MLKWLEKIPRSVLIFLGIFSVALLGLADYFTGIEFAFSVFYFIPLIIIAWYAGLRAGIFLSFVCASSWFLADSLGGHIYSSNYVWIWRILTRLLTFLIIAAIVYNFKKNSELAAENKLIAQKNYNIIATSQKITGIIANNISKYNSELYLWIAQQKADGKYVVEIIESTCRKIGSNLRALTEICFSQPAPGKNIDLDSFINLLQKKMAEINKKIIKK